MSCSDYPTAQTAKTFNLDAITENERVTLEQDRTNPASDGKTKKTMWGIENDAALQRDNIDQLSEAQRDNIDDLAESQRENLESTFTAQFAYKRIGNISLYVGDSLPEVDKLNSYQYPDDSGEWYGPIQSQSFPITIPSDPSTDRGWALVNAVTTSSLGGLTNYQAASVADMIAGKPVGWEQGDPVIVHTVGQVWSINRQWKVKSISNPMTYEDFTSNGEIHADDFSGSLSEALDVVRSGESIVLSARDYDIVGKHRIDTIPFPGGNWSGNEVTNVKIIGAGMPLLSDDESRFISGSGSVIQGALINFADGFECYNLGVDVGDHVVDNLNSGDYMEGFIPCTHKINTAWNDSANEYKNNIHFGNIKTLLKQPTGDVSTHKHSCLLGYVDGGTHGYLECVGGFFGFAYKSRNITALGDVNVRRNTSFSVIFKTDEYTECGDYHGRRIITGRLGDSVRAAPIGFRAHDNTRFKGISFEWTGRNCKGIVESGSFNTRQEDVHIRDIDVDDCDDIAVNIPTVADRWIFGMHSIVNSVYGFFMEDSIRECNIGSGVVQGVSPRSITGYILDGDTKHGQIVAREHSQWGVQNNGATINPSMIDGANNANGNISGNKDITSAVILANGWVSGGNPFRVTVADGRLYIEGEVSGGAGDVIVAGSSVGPSKAISMPVTAYDGSNWITMTCTMSTTGEIRVINAASMSGFISFNAEYYFLV
ncbi:hypothetical protein NVP1135O_37 [Vibrio phage 1.135.O._10N.222.54.B6]|nr:hypothetical protein NVP1135O_37 [Vibrio phage 1.135.O._10N.222.54.B6]